MLIRIVIVSSVLLLRSVCTTQVEQISIEELTR